MNLRIYSIIGFCLLMLSSSVAAQQSEQTQVLTLDDAITMAYMRNPSISAAQSGIEAATHRKKAAWGLGAPKLSVGADYTYMSQDILNIDLNGQKNTFVGFLQQLPIPLPPAIITGLQGLDLSYTLQKRDFGVVGATLVVPVFTGGKINAVNRAAKIGIENAKNSMEETRADLFTEITERYWGLALARNIENLRAEVVKSMTNHAKDAAQLEQNGLIARGERLFADMALSQAKAAYTDAVGNSQTINVALCGSLAEQGNYHPVTALFINQNIPSLQFFKDQTAQNSHLLEKVDLLRRLSEEMVKVQRADFFPTIGAMGAANIWDYNLSNQIPQWTVGAGIKLRIFDGLTTEQSYAAARSDVRRAEALQDKAKMDIQTLVEKLYSTLQTSIQQVKAAETTISFANEYLRMKTEAFAEGMSTSNDVVDAQINLAKSQIERMAAAYVFDTTLAKLLAVAGISDTYATYQIAPENQIISY